MHYCVLFRFSRWPIALAILPQDHHPLCKEFCKEGTQSHIEEYEVVACNSLLRFPNKVRTQARGVTWFLKLSRARVLQSLGCRKVGQAPSCSCVLLILAGHPAHPTAQLFSIVSKVQTKLFTTIMWRQLGQRHQDSVIFVAHPPRRGLLRLAHQLKEQFKLLYSAYPPTPHLVEKGTSGCPQCKCVPPLSPTPASDR